MSISLLSASKLPDAFLTCLRERFDCHHLPDLTDETLMDVAPRIRGIVAGAESAVGRALIDRLPALEIISVFGVGYDGIDLDAARERGIVVTNTPGASTQDVADLAFALLLAAARHVVNGDAFVRAGKWVPGVRYPYTARVAGGRLGIVGLGRIGRAVAQRALGFGMAVSYTGPNRKDDVPFTWVADLRALAASVDFLVVCACGGTSTARIIDASVIEALGPDGVLVNVARGSLVDEEALVVALEAGTIRAAGLDVFGADHRVPAAMQRLDNVVLTPHVGAGTRSAVQDMIDLASLNLNAHFAGRPVPAPVL